MSDSNRVKGQECVILVTSGGELESEFTDIRQFEMSADFEIKSEGYLGEKTNRKDMVFNGAKGSCEMHIHSGDLFAFTKKLKDKAQRKTPDVAFNISGIFSFPNGDTWTGTLPDVSFGSVPITVGTRGDYVTVKLEFEADDFDFEQE